MAGLGLVARVNVVAVAVGKLAGWPELVAGVGLHVGRYEEQRDDRDEVHGQLHCVDNGSARTRAMAHQRALIDSLRAASFRGGACTQ